MTPTPSQDARDYAAQVLRETGSQSLACEVIRTGGADNNPVVQAFARFEAHLRSTSPAEEVGEIAQLAEVIRTRLLGVSPDDQDVVLEDDDWRLILERLAASDTEAMPK